MRLIIYGIIFKLNILNRRIVLLIGLDRNLFTRVKNGWLLWLAVNTESAVDLLVVRRGNLNILGNVEKVSVFYGVKIGSDLSGCRKSLGLLERTVRIDREILLDLIHRQIQRSRIRSRYVFRFRFCIIVLTMKLRKDIFKRQFTVF
jgi:hypothetical protein